MRVVVGVGDPTDGLFNDVSALARLRLPVALGSGRDAASKKVFFKRLFHVCVLTVAWSPLDKKVVPLFQEEDLRQRALIGLVRKTDDARTHKHFCSSQL